MLGRKAILFLVSPNRFLNGAAQESIDCEISYGSPRTKQQKRRLKQRSIWGGASPDPLQDSLPPKKFKSIKKRMRKRKNAACLRKEDVVALVRLYLAEERKHRHRAPRESSEPEDGNGWMSLLMAMNLFSGSSASVEPRRPGFIPPREEVPSILTPPEGNVLTRPEASAFKSLEDIPSTVQTSPSSFAAPSPLSAPPSRGGQRILDCAEVTKIFTPSNDGSNQIKPRVITDTAEFRAIKRLADVVSPSLLLDAKSKLRKTSSKPKDFVASSSSEVAEKTKRNEGDNAVGG